VGSRAKVKVVKNKVAPPFREAEFDILYGEGISKEGDLLDLGVDHKIIEKSGAWYAIDGERMGQGRENARQFLKDNPDIRRELDNRLRQGLGLPVLEDAAAAAAARAEKPEKGSVVPMPEKKKA
jgi:recombination protein RecA